MSRNLVAQILLLIVRVYIKLFIKLTVHGGAVLPQSGPLIVISNHFSWFEAPLARIHLPYTPTFIAAAELAEESCLARLLFYAASVIEVRRGHVNRGALKRALSLLEKGEIIMIFPEGGIDPELVESATSGKPVRVSEGHRYRSSGKLIRARPGSALLALLSEALILPIAFHGTEQVEPNTLRLHRTRVTMSIGEPFGPFISEPNLRAQARKNQLDQMTELMMRKIAALLPPESRGPYA